MAPKIDYVDLLKKAGITRLKIADGDGEDDLSRLAPAFRATDNANAIVKSMAATIDYNAIIGMLLPMLISFVQGLLAKKPKAEEPAPAPSPVPTPTPTPVPQPTPTPAPVGRRIASFRGKWHQIVHEGRSLSAEEFKKRIDRSDPVREKDRIVADYSPLDATGREIRDGEWTPELRAAMFFPNGTHRCRYYGNNSEISHITMNHELGLMPRIKVDDGTLDNDQEAETGSLYGLYYTDGEAPADDDPDESRPHIRMPDLPSLRAKG